MYILPKENYGESTGLIGNARYHTNFGCRMYIEGLYWDSFNVDSRSIFAYICMILILKKKQAPSQF